MKKTTERLTWCCSLVWFMLQKCTGRNLGSGVTSLKQWNLKEAECTGDDWVWASLHERMNAGTTGVGNFPQKGLVIKGWACSSSVSDHIGFLPQYSCLQLSLIIWCHLPHYDPDQGPSCPTPVPPYWTVQPVESSDKKSPSPYVFPSVGYLVTASQNR